MTAPTKRSQGSALTLDKTPAVGTAKAPNSRLAAKLDRLVFAAPMPQRFGID